MGTETDASVLKKARKLAKAREARGRKERADLRATHYKLTGAICVKPKTKEPIAYTGECSEPHPNVATFRIHGATHFARTLKCECSGCAENEMVKLQADKLWHRGQTEEAIQMARSAKSCCERWLTLSLPPVPYPRAVKSKNLDWVSPLEKRLTGTGMEELFGPSATLVPNKKSREQKARDVSAAEVENRSLKLGSSDWAAEVVAVITTSPSSGATFFHSSCRMINTLNSKGVEYIVVSTDNRRGSPENKLLREWREKKWLFADPKKSLSRVGADSAAPQLLVDGVVLGDAHDLQDLIEENDLDYILARKACAACLYQRLPGSKSCPACGAVFRELVSSNLLSSEELDLLISENRNNAGKVGKPGPETFAVYCSRLGLPVDDDTMYITSDKLKKTAVASIGFSVSVPDGDENSSHKAKIKLPSDPNEVASSLMQEKLHALYAI